MKQWLTVSEAALILGRSKRTIRRWLADPGLRIRTQGAGATRELNAADLARVEARKTAYMADPTFGKQRPPLFGTVAEQRAARQRENPLHVSNVTGVL